MPWEQVVFGLALGLCALTLLKNLTDADSAWISYLGVGLAAGVAMSAYLDWSRESASGEHWSQSLEQEHAVLPRAVVVLGHPIDLEPERLVKGDRASFAE